jgi:hypothetical protein
LAFWNPPQICIWIATRDEVLVNRLRPNHTFAELAFEEEMAGRLRRTIGALQLELLEAATTAVIVFRGRFNGRGFGDVVPSVCFTESNFFDELPFSTNAGDSETIVDRKSGGVLLRPADLQSSDYWDRLVVDSSEVMKQWPPETTTPLISTVGRNAASLVQTTDAAAQMVHPRADRGRRRDHRNAVETAIAELYPGGFPPDGKIADLVGQLRAEKSVITSADTVRRALGRRLS